YSLLFGTGLLVLLGGITYSCRDFLDVPPQGALDAKTLTNSIGVEGSLIAAYRGLDCTNSTNSNWGCAASNWVWGSVPSDDAYKGSEATDQPGVTDIELYNWTTGSAGDAPQRGEGTSHQVDGPGVQGQGAGVRPRLCGRDHDAERGRGERRLRTGNELRSRLDRVPAVCRRPGDHPRLPGIGE